MKVIETRSITKTSKAILLRQCLQKGSGSRKGAASYLS